MGVWHHNQHEKQPHEEILIFMPGVRMASQDVHVLLQLDGQKSWYDIDVVVRPVLLSQLLTYIRK